MSKPAKVYWKTREDDEGKLIRDCVIRRNGRFFSFVSIVPCHDNDGNDALGRFYLEMLMGCGTADHHTGAFRCLAEAKNNAVLVTRQVISDLQSVEVAYRDEEFYIPLEVNSRVTINADMGHFRKGEEAQISEIQPGGLFRIRMVRGIIEQTRDEFIVGRDQFTLM